MVLLLSLHKNKIAEGMAKKYRIKDIAELEKRGTIKKVYGGIMRNQTNIPEPFAAREIKNKRCPWRSSRERCE